MKVGSVYITTVCDQELHYSLSVSSQPVTAAALELELKQNCDGRNKDCYSFSIRILSCSNSSAATVTGLRSTESI